MTRWLTDDEQATWRAFIAMNRIVDDALERQLSRDHGMPMMYYLILAMLSEEPDRRMTLSALARVVRASPSRLSHALNRLEDQGWVRRVPHPTDRRTTIAELTDAGHDTVRDAAPGHVDEVVRVIFSRLTPDQVHQLRAVAEAVVGGNVSDGDPVPPGCERALGAGA